MKWSVFTLNSNEVTKCLNVIQSLKDLQKIVNILQIKDETLPIITEQEQQQEHQAVG